MTNLLFTAAALTGLALPAIVWAEGTSNREVGKVLDEETRVFAGPCFYPPLERAAKPEPRAIRPLGGPLAAGVISALAETTLDFAIGALKAAGEEKSASAVVAFPANAWMYQLNKSANLVVNPEAQCIQILSGSFRNGFRAYAKEEVGSLTPVTEEKIERATREIRPEPDPDDGTAQVASWVAAEDESLALKKRYRQLRTVRFFMEVRVEQIKGTNDKFYLAPNGLYYRGPVESSWLEWRSRGTRNLLVTFTLSDPSQEEGKAFASVAMPFRGVEPGTKLTPMYFDGMTSRALRAPALSADDRAAVEKQQALFRRATQDMTLIGGPKRVQVLAETKTVRNASYKDALAAYCRAVEAYNAEVTKAKKEGLAIAAAECPVSVAEAKATYDDAKKAFEGANAERDARANNPSWRSGATGVICTPTGENTAQFAAGCELKSVSDHLPIVVTATVVEIKEPSKFLAFLGNALEKSKPAITAAVQAGLPAGREQAAEAQQKAFEEFELAKIDVAIAEKALAEADDKNRLEKSKDLLQKKFAANQKARAAGLPEPYPLP